MNVPEYYRSKNGRVFRLKRVSQELAGDRARYLVRATPVQMADQGGPGEPLEVVQEISLEGVRDKLRLHHAVQTPENTFGELWQRLRSDIETRD